MIYYYIDKCLEFYTYIIIARCIISFFPHSNHFIIRFIYDITEPVMAPLRRLLPAVGGFDFSPILVFLVLEFIRSIMRGLF